MSFDLRIEPPSVPYQTDHPPTTPPAWWQGSPSRFAKLVDLRERIHVHERRSEKTAKSTVGGILIVGVSIYSVDATGAIGMGAAPGVFAFFVALALPIVAAWLLDRRLAQQLCDVELRSKLWLGLLDDLRRGRIDADRLKIASTSENEIEYLLRKEATTAACFLASHETMSPHLPVFGQCFTLESR